MAIEAQPLDQSEVQRVWNGLNQAEWLQRYYGRLSEKFAYRNRLSLTIIGIFSLVAAAALFADLPSWARWTPSIPALFVACVAVLLSYTEYSRKAGIAASVAIVCMDLVRNWVNLWYDLYSGKARERAAVLEEQENRLTSLALIQSGMLDEKLREKYQKEAYEYCSRTYGSTPADTATATATAK